jgi:radical SAM superfamily enzyme YgiQ (UPF0313 family)
MESQTYTYDFAMVFTPRWGVHAPWTAPAYLLEPVRTNGFSAQSLDYNIRFYWSTMVPELWDSNLHHQYWKTQPLDYFLDQIDLREIDARVVGFSLTETNIRFSIELARRIKRMDPNKTIIFGGHRVFFEEDPEDQVPLDACDAIVKGEGELTLLDILQNGLNKNIGTYTPEGDRWVFNGERELIKDLDQFPWPRYEDVDWNHFPGRQMTIMGSRGCIFRCAFCNDIVRARHRYRQRSAGHIAEEMLYHKAKNNVVFTGFNDPLINGNYKHLDELCEILLAHNYDRAWAANLAIRRNMPVELMCKAKRAGMHAAVIGLEAGNPNVLKLMKKRFTIEDAEWFMNALHEAGINIDLNLVVGFPGETEEDFQYTIEFITKMAPKVSQIVSVATLNLDRSYLWDHLDEYDVVRQPEDRHISWYTKDKSNTYEVRVKRAERLIDHAHGLGLTHDRFDADIERKDRVMSAGTLRRRRLQGRTKHCLKRTLQRTNLLGAAQRVRLALSNLRKT